MNSSPAPIPMAKNRLRVGLGAALVLVVLGVAVAVLVAALGSHGETREVVPTAPADAGPSSTGPGTTIYVHVLGAVAHPGLFALKDGDRVVDAIAAAGGFAGEADQAQLNLARPLSDGEQVAVPVIGAPPPVSANAPGTAGTAGAAGTKVNLNTADETALETLPRVGPAMAARIIAWRQQNGRFSSVEDLMSVSGVGDKTFAELKDLVTV